MRSVLTVTLVLLLAPAAKAASWSAAMPVSTSGKFIRGGQDAAANARGDAVVIYRRSDRIEYVARAAGGPFGRPVVLARGGADTPQVALDDAGDAIAVWSDGRQVVGNWLATRKTFTLSAGDCTPSQADVALDGAGDATVTWASCPGTAFAATVPRGGDPGPPSAVVHDDPIAASGIPPDQYGTAFSASNADGTTVVISVRQSTLYAAFRAPGASAFSAPISLGVVEPLALAVAPDGSAMAIVYRRAAVAAIPFTAAGAGPAERVFRLDGPCSVRAAFDGAGALYVVGQAGCGGGAVWGAVRPAGKRFSGKARVFAPVGGSAQDPPSLATTGAGAVVAWPVGVGPPVNRSVLGAVAFRATPLIAFIGAVSRSRVRVRASQPVTVIVRVGKRVLRRRVSGTRTIRIHARSGQRVVVTVPGGDEIVRRV